MLLLTLLALAVAWLMNIAIFHNGERRPDTRLEQRNAKLAAIRKQLAKASTQPAEPHAETSYYDNSENEEIEPDLLEIPNSYPSTLAFTTTELSTPRAVKTNDNAGKLSLVARQTGYNE